MWLLYSASDTAVAKLMSELTYESSKRAEKLPMMSEMLIKLESKAPEQAMELLKEFKEYSWKPLSSYVHGGIHAMQRHGKGYPSDLLEQVLKASNGVLLMTGMLLVILSGDSRYSGKIPRVQIKYSDCLPPIKLPHSVS
ncbi:hypothetical protein GCM10007876_38000 [Litoribrevibacter albus]|uniref:Uncharacterized protein n=2 Tax=Litoribrevibacter albus TaxID=1473156 RepID=A0AA37SE14_9GAMM|nr:hypothetical protein GCM10007876_38000 [Litoribrevibacter albus]